MRLLHGDQCRKASFDRALDHDQLALRQGPTIVIKNIRTQVRQDRESLIVMKQAKYLHAVRG